MTRVEQILLHARALQTIQQESLVSATDGNETGGILLGRRSDAGNVHVHFAGTPGPAAIRSPDFFLRDLQHTKAFANRHYFDHSVVWIGEWHTHPHSVPIPSQQDLTTYTNLLADPELDFGGEFTSLILGPTTTSEWALVGWACGDMRSRQVPIRHFR
ncbi:Mov34/MPN/PAD-1 family protein [Rhodococcus jostii]|uniref:Mov34/MPN/PAD-1 family protein n=1 Tax=Rhodococcus jostii TaxID=132919 RepID=UPI0039823BAE